ncbi:eCIS core domain-containing protein [Streptomyces albireticuli]|uniref:eCIS core domain-containing protein n=1 Tax=Streptomyces albireticuli TaxID=1940 RepID=A0A2A2D2V1_9ACTN|nr:DUF4157 domain-containing protein [Streptomyces albireticuli]MCD9196240.1 DUF4157 domain-containing protein [Streptomyces albireticuli]PAU46763.1 hypothetical protein CK936_22470 [Streptomyces albireticuli]
MRIPEPRPDRTTGQATGPAASRRPTGTTAPAVPRRPAGGPPRPSPRALRALQRSAGNAAVAGLVARSKDRTSEASEEEPVRRSAVHEVLSEPGRPFTGALADEVEARYGGTDLSHLRVHTGAVAQRSAAEIGARAYTSGDHMVLGAGSTTEDVLHEVWHTFQQSRGPVSGRDNGDGLKVSEPDSPEEREAAAVAHELISSPVPAGAAAGAPAVQRATAAGPSVSSAHRCVQRAPAADSGGSQHSGAGSHQSTQPVFSFAPSLPANPFLYTDGDTQFWVGPNPPEGFFDVDQHCAYMATHWLLHGTPTGLRYEDFDDATRRDASDTVRRWAASGGLEAQEQYARTRLGGATVDGTRLAGQATSGKLPPGTLIWFGTSRHAEAAVVAAAGQFLMYDPNTGRTTTRDADGFAAYIASRNAFVVRYAPEAEHDASCKCCVIM